jgi:hypothetical protein
MILAIDGHTGVPLRHLSHLDPHLGYSTAAGENAPRQGISLDWVRGVERLHRLPAHAGMPQHLWGVFLNDFDQFIHDRGGWAEHAAPRLGYVGPVRMSSNARSTDERAGLLWRAGGPPVDRSAFTALRPERLPLGDAEVEAEIERLKALPRAEYEAQRDPAASRLGVRLSVLDRLRSDGAEEEVAGAIPLTAVPPPAGMSWAERFRQPGICCPGRGSYPRLDEPWIVARLVIVSLTDPQLLNSLTFCGAEPIGSP